MAKIRGRAGLAALAGAVLLLSPAAIGAQQNPAASCWLEYELAVGRFGELAGEPNCRPSPFQLRGTGDFAGSGLRSADINVEFWTTNTGLSDSGLELSGHVDPFRIYGTEWSPTGWYRQLFELQFYAAAARGDWNRNRMIAHSLQNVTGGGWSVILNTSRSGGIHMWQGRDGSAGLYHSGEQAAPEGCLDHGSAANRHYPYNFPLLAGSDCPETWGAAGWVFRRWVGSRDNWVDYFESLRPNVFDFDFDFRRVPADFQQLGKETVGAFQVFGAMSDHGAEVRAMYGNVIPGQAGEPEIHGYPIGINVYFNAYSFTVPKVTGGFIYEGFIVNESADVYGVPLDYDSLYFGINIRNAKGGRGAMYALVDKGMMVTNEWGQAWDADNNDFTDRFTNNATRVPGGPSSTVTGGARGFRAGMQGFAFLRTPLGDLRNKHFTNPDSPFYAPNHPLRGDTITFNRMTYCGTRAPACLTNEMINNPRRAFGILGAQPVHALGGRESRNLENLEYWHLFNVFFEEGTNRGDCDPTRPREFGCFGHYVPGVEGDLSPTWTYTNRPPNAPVGPDTLFFSTCRGPAGDHPERNSCVVTWSDTFPDKSLNGGTGGWWGGFGPFPLKAGDSAPVVIAAFGSPRRDEFFAAIDDWYEFYVEEFYLGPSSPPPPNIITVEARPGAYQFGDNAAVLYFDAASERWADEYSLNIVSEMREYVPGAPARTLYERIMSVDPGAADRLEETIMGTNVDTVYIFKSCDFVRTVTAQADPRCEPSPARDETRVSLGTGWQAYSWLTPDSRGRFSRSFTDSRVPAGTTVLYTLMATTPGIHLETKVPDPEFVPGHPDWDPRDETLVEGIKDTIVEILSAGRSPFSWRTGNPFVAEVYMPASIQSGAERPRVELIKETGNLPMDYWVEIRWYDRHLSKAYGRYRLVWGHQGIYTEYRSLPGRTLDSTVVQIERRLPALMPDSQVARLPYTPWVFVSYHPEGVPVRFHSGGDEHTFIDVDDQGNPVEITIRRSITGTRNGALLDVRMGNVPLHVASFGTGGWWFTPDEFQSHPEFRGFSMYLSAGTGSRNLGWELAGGDFFSESWPSLYRTNTGWWPNAYSVGARGARWQMRFGAPVFGYEHELPYVDIMAPENTIREFTQLMERRPRFNTSEFDEQIMRAVQLDMPGYELVGEDHFVVIDLPFEIHNLQHGGKVRIAVLREDKISDIVLGQAPDTVTVPVPVDRWTAWERLINLEYIPFVETNEDGTLKLDERGDPSWITDLRVTRNRWGMGCSSASMDPSRQTCNPVRGPRRAAVPGYVEVRPMGHPDFPEGMQYREVWRSRVEAEDEYIFEIHPAVYGADTRRVTPEELATIMVVPNPYIALNAFEHRGDVKRLMFTHLPPQGTIQIFTASGQFVQRLEWEPFDLRGNGDLFWDMSTREGTIIAAGLYLFVVETENPETGQKMKHMGKFVVIK